ncbi:MAG TPA: NifB/NifX family molybdenum-iron cluster-binding protein [Treponemataceae bacterium]|nr:NifB/NifX family molybdenum-iron cluster-binding protein [Treponemataceae bacterium]
MARPCSTRIISRFKNSVGQKDGRLRPLGNVIPMTLDELEALKLADIEGLYQEAAARKMGVSRQTFGRIIASARKKNAQALVTGAGIRIEGGAVRVRSQGETLMKIAVPLAGSAVDNHFGHCAEYAVYTVEDSKIVQEERLPSLQGCGCKSGIAPILAQNGISVMIAGNIGNGAINVLASNGIKTIKGASGEARAAAEAWLSGNLDDSGSTCSGHGEDHVCSH